MDKIQPDKGPDDLINLSFPPSFFEDEVRDGFFVPETMKRFWAGHLTVLSEVAKICARHEIRWFGAFGTLLGAVRHEGFIPWDDDIDIVMFRNDLDRFLEVAPGELPPFLSIRDVQAHPECDAQYVRVTSEFLAKDHLQHFQGSLYTANVDIFALDNRYTDEAQEKARMERLGRVCSAGAYFQPQAADADGKVRTRAQEEPEKAEAAVRRVEQMFGLRINRKDHPFGHLLQLITRVFRECPQGDSPEVVLFMDNEWYWKKERAWFRDTVWLPFEHVAMPVCVDYEKELVAEYGDWHKEVRGGGHGELPYKDQEDYMRKKTGKNMFRYTYSEADLHAERSPSMRAQAGIMLQMLREAQTQTKALVAGGQAEPAAQLLASCQMVAIRLGELLEGRFAPDSAVIRQIEAYCEAVYRCHVSPDAETLCGADESLEQTALTVKQAFAQKEIVFLPVRAAWWPAMEAAYRQAMEVPDMAVYVVPVSWYERDGQAADDPGKRHDESSLFPKDILLTPPEAYDIRLRQPDVIVTQFPYEGLYRPVAVDPLYYASSLRNLTEQLVYIPCYEPDTPEESDFTAKRTLRYLIEQPAVVFADQVIVGTAGMKQLYVDVMSEIAGEATRSIWENRIKTEAKFSKV